MQNNQPKFLTKNELCAAAIRELKVSKNSFDFAWIDAIERTGRHDRHKPLRRFAWKRQLANSEACLIPDIPAFLTRVRMFTLGFVAG